MALLYGKRMGVGVSCVGNTFVAALVILNVLAFAVSSGPVNAQDQVFDKRPGGCPEGPPCPKDKKKVAKSEPVAAASAAAASAAAVPGGGASQVWVNSMSRTYHCPSDKLYGKSKQGAYMTEAAAKQAGARPSNGRACK